jgi:NAD(P)-dependent dehydrogenase (short-subunit alcohol dehydrogenase family)
MKNVVITGSSSGFGYLAAGAFAERGYRVWATMRNAATKNAERARELEAASDAIRVVDMDVTDAGSVDIAIREVVSKDGKVDVLINNAGVMYIGHTEAHSVEQAHRQMDVNYYGMIRVSQAVLPHMRRAGDGLIINNSSVVGRMAWPYSGTYSATKHAVEAYSQALRFEVAPFGVDVAIVEPGPFPTSLIASVSPEARTEVIEEYGDMAAVPQNMLAYFGDWLQSDEAPDNQLVVDAYLALADAEPGTRPTRTVVGPDFGVNEMNQATQPIQDAVLGALNLDAVLARR